MVTFVIRSGIVVVGVLCTALSAAYGIGGAAGMALLLYAWLIVRPLADIVLWVGGAIVCMVLLHAPSSALVSFVLTASVVVFDIVRQYLARTNTRSRAVSGSIAVVLVLCIAYGLQFFGTRTVAWSGAQFIGNVAYSVVMLVLLEWGVRRAEQVITFFTYGSDGRRHI